MYSLVFLVKKRRNWHRHDYSEIDDGSKVKLDLNIAGKSFPYSGGNFWCNDFFLYYFDFWGCSGRNCGIHQRIKNQKIQVRACTCISIISKWLPCWRLFWNKNKKKHPYWHTCYMNSGLSFRSVTWAFSQLLWVRSPITYMEKQHIACTTTAVICWQLWWCHIKCTVSYWKSWFSSTKRRKYFFSPELYFVFFYGSKRRQHCHEAWKW